MRFEERLRVEIRERCAIVWLVRPGAGNLIDRAFLEAVGQVSAWLEGQDGLRGALWISEGRAFSLGADTTIFEALDPAAASALAHEAHQLGLRLRRVPMPQVACLNGLALGGGLELALWLDQRLMAANTALGLPELKLGILPAWGGITNLRRLAGAAAARDALFSGRMIRADEAERWGLVEASMAAGELLEAGLERLRRVPPARTAIAGLRATLDAGLEAELALEAEAFGRCFSVPDAHEGLRAQRERRPPNFMHA